jgi:hypothetical protein
MVRTWFVLDLIGCLATAGFVSLSLYGGPAPGEVDVNFWLGVLTTVYLVLLVVDLVAAYVPKHPDRRWFRSHAYIAMLFFKDVRFVE